MLYVLPLESVQVLSAFVPMQAALANPEMSSSDSAAVDSSFFMFSSMLVSSMIQHSL